MIQTNEEGKHIPVKVTDEVQVKHCWDAAWMLHVNGFQEGRLDIDYVAREVKDIEKLVKLAEDKRFEDRKVND